MNASEGLGLNTISAGTTLRSLARQMRTGTITRTGRTITRVRGADRASLTLDAQGRVKTGVIDDAEDGRYRLTVTYPAEPFKQVTPTPQCSDVPLVDPDSAGDD